MNGEITTTKFKALNQKPFILAKQEIQNVLFKVQEQTLEVGGNNRPTDLKTNKTPTVQHPSTSTPAAMSTREALLGQYR